MENIEENVVTKGAAKADPIVVDTKINEIKYKDIFLNIFIPLFNYLMIY